MKKAAISSCVFLVILGLGVTSADARQLSARASSGSRDRDRDGYSVKVDCNDWKASVYPGAPEVCGDGIDQNCDGSDEPCVKDCSDLDADGYFIGTGACGPLDCNDSNAAVHPGAADIACDGVDQDCSGADSVNATCTDNDRDGSTADVDCNDNNAAIHPGAVDTCGDGVDQDCSGADSVCNPGGPHANLSFSNYPSNCISCHSNEAADMFASTHYQWRGEAPDMVNGVGVLQGKLTNAVNSYCISILGDWPVCGSCHVGRGLRPDDPSAGLTNIDCLVCHNEAYAAARTRLADGTMGVANPTVAMIQEIKKPTRANCLGCHAKAGGGDGVKRGDLSLATITNADRNFDVHMNTAGTNLDCVACHVFENHRVIGKGSDLRATDDLRRGSEISCTTCHNPHGTSDNIGKHTARVACQTCHIPTYAKVATEVQRDWQRHSDGSPADGVSGPGHPYTAKAANLIPKYRWWNRMSDNSLLGDDAARTYDPELGTYPTSRPLGDVKNGKIYPFKYKTATQPQTTDGKVLIALDTFEYMKRSGDVKTAIEKGLVNMGYPAATPYEWIDTDTFQLLNHGVEPHEKALGCSQCHGSTARMDLKGELGYALKGPQSTVCTQCHGSESVPSFTEVHGKHVSSKQYDCSWCHTFSRPERGLKLPGVAGAAVANDD